MAVLVVKDYKELMKSLSMESTAKHSKRFLPPRGANATVPVFSMT